MKRIFILTILFIVLLTAFYSCGKDDDVMTKIHATDSGTFIDTRDGQIYRWVRYGNQEWMMENFKYEIGNADVCSIYLNAEDYETNPESTANLQKYGRLYNYEAAVDATPLGWRLPTDADWQNLEKYLGMSEDDANSMGWRGVIAHRMFTVKGDTCDLNLLLGGYHTTHTVMSTSGWRFLGAYGYYWTSTADTTKVGQYYFYRKFEYNRDEVYRQSMEPVNNQLSVRYVRDAN